MNRRTADRRLRERFYPASRFGGFTDVDGTVAFYARVNALLNECDTVVDVGCGRGGQSGEQCSFKLELRDLRRRSAHVIGLDVDRAAAVNPFVDEFKLLTVGEPWPLESRSADLLVSDCVLEHLDDPSEFFAESARVLRPGGYLCVRTPNVLGYVALLSRLVPNRHHVGILRTAQPHRHEEDVFPTHYRCNTRWTLRKTFESHGFDAVVYGYEAEPSYLGFSSIAYRLGTWHQRLAPDLLKLTLFGFGQLRPSDDARRIAPGGAV